MKKSTWADIALGLWLVLSPLVLGYTLSHKLLVAEDVAPGALLIITSIWLLVKHRDSLKASWIQGLSGLWLIIGSFALIFSHFPRAAANTLIVGLLVLAVDVISSWWMTANPDVMAPSGA